jgi:DNA-binding protein H-NS
MAKTYSQLLKDIEALTAQAQARKAKEAPGVIEKIKQAIEFYGLTASDLGLDGSTRSAPSVKVARKAVASKKTGNVKAASGAKYGDGSGNVWSGRGPRPHWLRDALANGRQLSEFLTGAVSAAPSADEAPAAKPAAKKRGAAKKAARGSVKAAAKKSGRAARGGDSAASATTESGATAA